MKTKRKLSINNSLVHGICNFNCVTCGINKSSYKGPKRYQPISVLKKILDRIIEANDEGLEIRHFDNSGDGEPTLHPKFEEMMNMIGRFQNKWKKGRPPVCSVVTNAFNLNEDKINILEKNNVALKISFPTVVTKHYGEIMMMDENKGKSILEKVKPNIELAIKAAALRQIPSLEFHLSPPYRKYLREDFSKTLEYLIATSHKYKLDCLKIEMFPSVSNRTGLVSMFGSTVDNYHDIFKKYNNKMIDGVLIKLFLSNKYFYPSFFDLWDLWKSFEFPCLWYGNFFISPDGDVICSNDQNVEEKNGNIKDLKLKQLLEMKEKHLPTALCGRCNQTPWKMISSKFFIVYNLLVELKLKFVKRQR